MRKSFRIYTERDCVIIENPAYPYIRAEVAVDNMLPEIRNVSVKGRCKISEVKRTLKDMVDYLEKHPANLTAFA
jgi:hypothetical protein